MSADVREGKREMLSLGAKHAADPDDLLENVYHLPPHPAVALPENLTWSENPFSDTNWVFQFHSLRFVYSLLRAWEETQDDCYLSRAKKTLRSWCENNPRENAPSEMSWDEHATSWRGIVLAYASTFFESEQWLDDALDLHGRLLSDDSTTSGNHALNHYIGLLSIGVAQEQEEWVLKSTRAITQLLETSVDEEGATNEQAIQYQNYNHARYDEAAQRLRLAGVKLPHAYERLERMPILLAHSTMPNGQYVNLGDTDSKPARRILGTSAEYAATAGRCGPKPERNHAVYAAGFAFGRTGWGEDRPFHEEVFYSLSFGPPACFHGHADGGSITLFAHGSELLVDPGKYKYVPLNKDPFRVFFRSPQAHNVMIVDRQFMLQDVETVLLTNQHQANWDFYHVRRRYGPRTAWDRRVLFVRPFGYLLIEDTARSDVRLCVQQLWHLRADADPTLTDGEVVTHSRAGDIQLVQILDTSTPRVLTGESTPIQGWVSPEYGKRVPAPTVAWEGQSTLVRFVTLALPFSKTPPLESVDGIKITANSIDLQLSAYGQRHDIRLLGNKARVSHPD